MSKVIVVGSVAYDRIMDFPGLFADHFLPDKIHSINLSFQVDKISVEFGGTAGNIAYNLALLGEQPEIISSVGADFAQYRSHLMIAGIDPHTIHEIDGELTASAFILTDQADNQIAAFHFGGGARAYDAQVDVEGRALAIVAPGCIPDMTAMPAYFRSQGMRYLYDPGQALSALTPEQLKDGMTGAQILFASDYEFHLIKEKTGLDQLQLLELVPTLVITYAGEGSHIISRDDEIKVASTVAKEVVDPTGAGDAYRAGFMKGMFWGLPLRSCGQLASCVAAYAVENYGTQTHEFTLAQLAERYVATYGEKLPV